MSSVKKYGKYSGFGKWVLEVVGKIYKIKTIFLMDALETSDMVCIIPSLQEN